MITALGHVAFRVTKLDPALHFYCDILGLREAFRLDREGSPSPWIVYLQVALGQFVELFPGAENINAEAGDGASYDHFCLHVDGIQQTVRQLAERGLPIEGAPTMVLDNNYQYWVTDPDGNRIELMEIKPESPHAAADSRWSTAR